MKKIFLFVMVFSFGLMVSCSTGTCASSCSKKGCCKNKQVATCTADCTKACCANKQAKSCAVDCTKPCCSKK